MAPPQIPGYHDLHLIGRGGFAQVFAASQPAFGGRTVAIKVLTIDSLDEGGQQRFERECHAAGRISWHPNVVNVYEAGTTEDGQPYLVMEHMARGSLGDLVTEGPLSWERAATLAVPLAGALEAAHRAGTLHRDVKPQNVLVGHLDEPKLADFGIARVEGTAATTSRTMRATLAHAPPEALDGKSSVAGDVYALASTTYELITATPAFVRPDDDSVTTIMARLATAPVPDLRPLGVPDAIAQVIEQAMAKDPADRPPTAQSFGEAMQEALRSSGHRPPRMVVSVHSTSAVPEPAPARQAADTALPEPRDQATPEPEAPAPAPLDPYGPRDDGPPTGLPEGADHPQDAGPPEDGGRPDGAADRGWAEAAGPEAHDAAPSPPEPPSTGRRRRLLLLALGAVSLSIVLAGGLALVNRGGGPDRTADGGSAEGDPTAPPTASAELTSTTIDVGPAPLGVAVSGELVYVADLQADEVTVLELASGEVRTTLDVEGRPRRVAAAGEGGVWVTLATDEAVAAVGPDGERGRAAVGGDPIGVAEGFGSVWVVNAADGTLSRLTGDDTTLQATITDVAQDPRQVAAGAGAIWVSDAASGEVVRIDPDTNEVTDRIPVGDDPIGMAFGEGAVWVTSSGDGTLVRLDPEAREVVATVVVGSTPVAVAVADGLVWVANQGDATVSVVDVSTGEVTGTAEVGAQPGGVAVGGGSAWVTNMGDGTVSRLTLG